MSNNKPAKAEMLTEENPSKKQTKKLACQSPKESHPEPQPWAQGYQTKLALTFEHAVEFSKNTRAPDPPVRASLGA
jgi:hypothetical protein